MLLYRTKLLQNETSTVYCSICGCYMKNEKGHDMKFKKVCNETQNTFLVQYSIVLKKHTMICKNCNESDLKPRHLDLRKCTTNVGAWRAAQGELKRYRRTKLPNTRIQRQTQRLQKSVIRLKSVIEKNQDLWIQITKQYERISIDLEDVTNYQQYVEKSDRDYKRYCNQPPDAVIKQYKKISAKWFEKSSIGLVGHTNRKINCLSYCKLSDADCRALTRLTRQQIRTLRAITKIPERKIFLFFNKLLTNDPFERQALYYGGSGSTYGEWFKTTTQILYEKWAKKLLVTDSEDPDQYWTREKVDQFTPNFVKRLLNLNVEHLAYVMDSTYCYTNTLQCSHPLFKKCYSMQKHRNLYKPHLMVTAMGKIVNMVIAFADGHNNDASIYRSLFCVEYVKKKYQETIQNWYATDYHQLNDQMRPSGKWVGINYLNTVLFRDGDRTFNDNGYRDAGNDRRVKAPLLIPKTHNQLSVVKGAWRRHITSFRNVIERINKNLKRWRMLGDGKLNVYQIPNLPELWSIACAHHNQFGVKLLVDSDRNTKFANRLLAVRDVWTNPCERFWRIPPSKQQNKKTKVLRGRPTGAGSALSRGDATKPKSTKKTKKKKQRKNKKKKQNENENQDDDEFDDGFTCLAIKPKLVFETIRQFHWLKRLNLDYFDGMEIIGNVYQQRLCNYYLKNLETIKLSEWHGPTPEGKYVLRFSRIQSKYIKAKKRTVILCFDEIIKNNRAKTLEAENRRNGKQEIEDLEDEEKAIILSDKDIEYEGSCIGQRAKRNIQRREQRNIRQETLQQFAYRINNDIESDQEEFWDLTQCEQLQNQFESDSEEEQIIEDDEFYRPIFEGEQIPYFLTQHTMPPSLNSNNNTGSKKQAPPPPKAPIISGSNRSTGEKQWKDIPFDEIFEGKLGRLQWWCSCPGGAVLVNPCAHVASMIYLIIACLKGEEFQCLTPHRLHTQILDKIHDTEFHKQQLKEFKPKYCFCDQPFIDGEFLIECESCHMWLHPECMGQDSEIYQGVDTTKFQGFQCFKCIEKGFVGKLWKQVPIGDDNNNNNR